MKYRSGLWIVLVLLVCLATGTLSAQPTEFNESPMLAERVAAGELPPVEERLPTNPRVIDLPWSDVGTYGGDFKDPFVGDAFWSAVMSNWKACTSSWPIT